MRLTQDPRGNPRHLELRDESTSRGRSASRESALASGFFMRSRWPGWAFGTLPDGRRYARRGRRIVAGPSLGYLDRVLWSEPPAAAAVAREWEVAA